MPRGSAAPEPLSMGAGVRGGCLAAAGLLPCLDEAHLPWHQGRDAPSASLSGQGPAPSPCRALPHLPRFVLSVWGRRTDSSPPACHDPTAHCLADRGGAFPWLRAGGLCALRPCTQLPAAPLGLAGGSTPCPAVPGCRAPCRPLAPRKARKQLPTKERVPPLSQHCKTPLPNPHSPVGLPLM